MNIKEHKSYIYAKNSIDNKRVPKYVQLQCKDFLKMADDEDDKYIIDLKLVELIDNLLKLMNMSTGLKVGKTVYESLAGFQWLFIVSILCSKHRSNIEKRRYETATLFIGRKAGKTFLISVIFALLQLIEPQHSEFYSVAADGDLSRLIKKEFEQLLTASPLLNRHFKVRRTDITCNITNSVYKPLNFSLNRLDGRMANVFLADEVGSLPTSYPIDAMKSSQINMLNRLGILISTAYNSVDNVMVEEVEYAKKVLDDVIQNDTYFSLLYCPDEDIAQNWKTDDLAIYQSNPLVADVPENLDYLLEQRKDAIDRPSSATNFLTKHLNIFVNGSKDEAYMDIDLWKKCQVDKVDFEGKDVVVAVDGSISLDLTSVSIMYKEDGKYYCMSHGFLPGMNMEDRRERIDYYSMERQGYCEIHDAYTVQYNLLEEYIRGIEDKYNCRIITIVSDPFNMKQTMENLAVDYDVVMLKQTYTNLSPATKNFRDEVYNSNVFYQKNELLDWNVSNATVNTGKSGDIMLAKDKASKNKKRIDMLATLIFCMTELYLEEEDTYDAVESLLNQDW